MLGIRRAGLPAAMALGLITATAGQAGAFLIDNTTIVDDTFLVEFELLVGATDDSDPGNTLGETEALTAEMLFTVDAVSALWVSFTVKISNTTAVDPAGADAIHSIGFFTNPEVTLSNVTLGSVFESVEEDPKPSLPAFAAIDICLYSGNCAGGAIYDGLQNLEMDTVMFTLSWLSGDLTIDPSAVQFQGERGSFQFKDGNGDMQVPEPNSLAIFGIGLLGLGFLAGRRGLLAV